VNCRSGAGSTTATPFGSSAGAGATGGGFGTGGGGFDAGTSTGPSASKGAAPFGCG
jgi:hypothetical protein